MKDAQKLQKYLVKKLDSIYQIYASYENDLVKNKIKLSKSGLSEKDIGKAYVRLEYIEGNLFRQAMLIMVCSYLEEAMNLMGELLISNYSKKIKKEKNGNWFDKRKRLFENAGVSFKVIEDECEKFSDLWTVRKCIVHDGGRVEENAYRERVEKAIKRLNEKYKDRNMILVELMQNEFLYLGDDIIVTAIIASQRIIEQCSNAKSIE